MSGVFPTKSDAESKDSASWRLIRTYAPVKGEPAPPTEKYQTVWEALLDVANNLHFPNYRGGVIAQEVQKLARLTKKATSFLVCIGSQNNSTILSSIQYLSNVVNKVNRVLVCQQTWKSAGLVQFQFLTRR